ncbi:hypothetical protein ACFZDG_27510 [Kitasatospora xanthocidica]|uniref:hypothetical protein n=1 Tax=Kitasatospora xanthocidica TaxID=83382 RepID=UPI0036EAF19E
MPGTRQIGGRTAGRAARWLAAALLVPALVSCGGGGGDSASAQRSDNGQNGGGQNDNGGQTGDQRTQDTGNQGGFRTAGEPSANVQGTDNTALIKLSFPARTSFQATISKVADCGTSRFATPASRSVEVVDGETERAEFTLPQWKPGTTSRTICLTVTVDGSSKQVQAVGTVEIITIPDSGTTPGNGTTPGGGATPYGGASVSAGSNP